MAPPVFEIRALDRAREVACGTACPRYQLDVPEIGQVRAGVFAAEEAQRTELLVREASDKQVLLGQGALLQYLVQPRDRTGPIPSDNTVADGYYGTCPVDAFPANGYGLHNATGNVWEWAADWFQPSFRLRDRRINPIGPPSGTHRVQKGGSYLCHEPDSTTGNVGFRCASDVSRG